MRSIIKNIFVIVLVNLCLMLFWASTAGAQNFAGTVSPPEAKRMQGNMPAGNQGSVYSASAPLEVQGSDVVTPGIINVVDPLEEDLLSEYTLGKLDVVEIVVMRHPEVSGQYPINNEGKIQYEFVGDLKIEGLKKDEVQELIIEAISEYIISPEVTVKIVGYNSKVVYVIGEVGRPGKIFMRGDKITVREALMQAGLPLLSASTRKGKLITPSEDGDPAQKQVDVYALLYEGDLRENFVMEPGDTLFVPPTFMAKTMRVISPIAQPVMTGAGAGRSVVAPF